MLLLLPCPATEGCKQDQTVFSTADPPALPSIEAGRQKVFEILIFGHPEGSLTQDSS